MHGLATYAERLGLAPKMQPTRRFSLLFWKNCTSKGRVNELKLTLAMYFGDGFVQGIKNAWAMRHIGLGMLLAKRLNPLELFKGHECKDVDGIHRMLKKAYEIEDRKRGIGK
jgi:quinone-modifying oxidoreductase subunit QmoC